MPDLPLLHTGRRFGAGRFTLVRFLGRGGMGEVWLARDERLEEPVALKFLPSEIRENPPTLEHLRLETARSHRLTHPNIVRVHDFHEPAGEPAFISMEYVDGGSLNAFRQENANKLLSWDYLRKPLADLCAALEYAHAENVIHRDLKPDNMLIDSRGRLKLTDFGLAAMATDLARLRTVGGGTLQYMSPQQLEGKHPHVTDDVYALGATLYELLTGQLPFHDGDIRAQVLHQAPEPPHDRLAALGMKNEFPSGVAALIMSCLAKDPAQRPQTIRAVADWSRMSERNPRTLQNAPGVAETPVRPARRRAKVLGLAVVAAMALAAGGLLLTHRPVRPEAALPVRLWPAAARWTNSLGMVFVPVPGSEAMFCIWLTRVQDYQAMVDATGRPWKKPSFEQGPTHPAVNVKWNDATAFCEWLTERERGLGIISTNQNYRLPTDAEWSLAVGLGHEDGATPEEKDQKIQGVYPWGTEWPPPRGAGNFDPRLNVDDFPYTSPVGSFAPNAYGLYDMAGNAREWCEDLYSPHSHRRSVRGSAWFDTPAATLLSSRRALTSVERHDNRYDFFGFRCALVTGVTPAAGESASIVFPAADPAPANVPASPENTLSPEEIAAGWKLLFDGHTTSGWRGYKMAQFPARGWRIDDGCLVNPKSNGRPNGSGGDLVTTGTFLNFDFRFEWRIGHGGNSGVQYFFDENRPKTPVPMYGGDTGNSPMGFEYQILDDPNYERELKNGPKHLTAALYLLIAPDHKHLRPAGEFNQGRIVVNGNRVEHWLNGVQVLACELESPALLQAIAQTKFKWIAGLGHKRPTQLALQDHGDEVAFRNLKIRELGPGAAP